MTETAIEISIDVIVQLLREYATDGWLYTANIEDVPEATGHYGLNDGLLGRGGGVTINMRQSIKSSRWFTDMKRPVFSWLPDTDGSAALWLDGKIRCNRCASKPIIDMNEIDQHGVDLHGDEPLPWGNS